jgi:hypothetical protein
MPKSVRIHEIFLLLPLNPLGDFQEVSFWALCRDRGKTQKKLLE